MWKDSDEEEADSESSDSSSDSSDDEIISTKPFEKDSTDILLITPYP